MRTYRVKFKAMVEMTTFVEVKASTEEEASERAVEQLDVGLRAWQQTDPPEALAEVVDIEKVEEEVDL